MSKRRPDRPQVLVVMEVLFQYRLPFYEHLRLILDQAGIDLVLVHGQPDRSLAFRQDTRTLSWAKCIRNRRIPFGGRTLIWQPALSYALQADLVIVEQASKLLLNYVLFALYKANRIKLAFWGHGKSFRPDPSTLGEKIKHWLSLRVHWWFAYNELTTKILTSQGYTRNRITSVNNAIDTRALLKSKECVTPENIQAVRDSHNIQGDHVCLFIGGMYASKRIPFLLDACKHIRKQIPDFEMLFVGAGEQALLVEQASRQQNWIHYIGPRFGAERIPYFLLSKLLLMPSEVGLAILDALVLETPIITTNVKCHGPEIIYLRDKVNGRILPNPDDVQAYADAVSAMLKDVNQLKYLKEGCRHDALTYTIEDMASRFAQGIRDALRT